MTFHAPDDPKYDFKTFYQEVKKRGYILYPGKLTQVETFRVGCMGHFGDAGIPGAVAAVADTLKAMGIGRFLLRLWPRPWFVRALCPLERAPRRRYGPVDPATPALRAALQCSLQAGSAQTRFAQTRAALFPPEAARFGGVEGSPNPHRPPASGVSNGYARL